MKHELDDLMEARQLDALVVAGGEHASPERTYLSNGARITHGLIVRVRGSEPLLVVSGMEVEEAQASGLPVVTIAAMGYPAMLKETGRPEAAAARLMAAALAHAGLDSGRVGLYGTDAINQTIANLDWLAREAPAYTFVGEAGDTLFAEAFQTKDASEMARIRMVAERTNAVMAAAWDFIASHRASGDVVVDDAGAPLTIGAVKRFVLHALLDHDLEDTGMIFAQGRDAGFPHSRGQADQALRLGQTIVFDLFPREAGGGYHHDMTRTWCIGHAPPAAQALYDDVMAAFDAALAAYAVGAPTHQMQEAVQTLFEERGHPTLRSDPGTMAGYVHSLGHGVGLEIHERPAISHMLRGDVFRVGNCITIEPGLYYPERGMGVRVEDLFIIDEGGALGSLTPFRKDLVLPLRG